MQKLQMQSKLVSPIPRCTLGHLKVKCRARKARSKRLLQKGKLPLQQASAESCKSKKFPTHREKDTAQTSL